MQSVVYSYVPIISIAFYLGMDVAYMRNASSLAEAVSKSASESSPRRWRPSPDSAASG